MNSEINTANTLLSDDMAQKSAETSILLDFYGEMLSEKQHEAVTLWCDEDLSLSEIALICKITRAGVRDRIVKSEKILHELEDKLGLAKRFSSKNDTVKFIINRLSKIRGEDVSDIIEAAQSLLN